MIKRICLLLLAVMVIFAVIPIMVNPSNAAEPVEDYAAEPDGFIEQFQTALGKISDKLQSYAKSLFFTLAIIQFTYNMGILLIRGQLDMNTIASTLLRQIMLIGIFYFLLTKAPYIFDTIIQSFRIAATGGGGDFGALKDSISPGAIYTQGVVITNKLTLLAWDNASILRVFGFGELSYGQAIYISLICLVILMSFAVMTAIYTLSLIKWYFISTASMLFLGFGGSEWSSDIAKNTFKSVLSIGAEIFVILLIANVATEVTSGWIAEFSTNSAMKGTALTTRASTMGAMSLIIVVLTLTAPSLASGLISGSAIGAGGTAAVAAMAGAAGGAALSKIGQGAANIAKKGGSKIMGKAKQPMSVGRATGQASAGGGAKNSVSPGTNNSSASIRQEGQGSSSRRGVTPFE